LVTPHAEFDQYRDAVMPVPSVRQSLYYRSVLPTNYHHLFAGNMA